MKQMLERFSWNLRSVTFDDVKNGLSFIGIHLMGMLIAIAQLFATILVFAFKAAVVIAVSLMAVFCYFAWNALGEINLNGRTVITLTRDVYSYMASTTPDTELKKSFTAKAVEYRNQITSADKAEKVWKAEYAKWTAKHSSVKVPPPPQAGKSDISLNQAQGQFNKTSSAKSAVTLGDLPPIGPVANYKLLSD